jgi:2-polyprenyl-3-methyl-5-hydroxy-6-metoxy-1,4-benzoquinol methylase
LPDSALADCSLQPLQPRFETTIDTVTSEHFDDPVAAYDRIAPHYADLSHRRERYLRGVEREIVSRIPKGHRSLLDVGAGDGTRACRIASELGINRVVLLEPSRGMMAKAAESTEVWRARAEDLASGCFESAEQFDVITCLWNVLGHVPSAEKRLGALGAIASLLTPGGRFFLDVNHRHNARSYGVLPTAARWLRDLFSPNENNGDALAKWNAGDAQITTFGHVFTHREIIRLTAAAGLEMETRVVVDHQTGRTRRFAFQGNLLYVFRCNSRIDSSSAPQTS